MIRLCLKQQVFLHVKNPSAKFIRPINYGFPKSHKMYSDYEEGIIESTSDPAVLKEVSRTLSADHLSEASNPWVRP